MKKEKKMKKIILFTFMVFLIFSCSENSTSPLLDPFTKSLLVPNETDVDGGLFLISTAKNNDSVNPAWIKARVVLHYKNWLGSVSIFLDDSLIKDYSQMFNISPFIEHSWDVLENQQVGIPRIHKTVPALQPLTISNLQNYDTISRNQTIYWNTPINDTSTKVFILLQKFLVDTTATDSLWIIPSQDNGTFTFSTNYFNNYNSGEKIRIDIFRVKSMVETYENKKYLFATLFETHLILYVK